MILTDDKAIFLFKMNCLPCCKKYDDKYVLYKHYVEEPEVDSKNYFLKIYLKKTLMLLFRINV